MFERGLLAEAAGLLDAGIAPNTTMATRAIGYRRVGAGGEREIWDCAGREASRAGRPPAAADSSSARRLSDRRQATSFLAAARTAGGTPIWWESKPDDVQVWWHVCVS